MEVNLTLGEWCAMDEDGYPFEGTLKAIRTWPAEHAWQLFRELERIWKWPDYIELVPHRKLMRLHTGGWSGHEDIVHALQKNQVLWMMTWESSRRGGHYVFRQRY